MNVEENGIPIWKQKKKRFRTMAREDVNNMWFSQVEISTRFKRNEEVSECR